jgi:hypothetical protein
MAIILSPRASTEYIGSLVNSTPFPTPLDKSIKPNEPLPNPVTNF